MGFVHAAFSMPNRRRALPKPHVNGLRQVPPEERTHIAVVLERHARCVWLGSPGHTFIGTDQPRLPAYLSLGTRFDTHATAG